MQQKGPPVPWIMYKATATVLDIQLHTVTLKGKPWNLSHFDNPLSS